MITIALDLYAYLIDPDGVADPATVCIAGYDALNHNALVRRVGTDYVWPVTAEQLIPLPVGHVWEHLSI